MGITLYGTRPQCLRCMRPVLRCICALIPPVDNQTPVWVLQHPKERCHPFGTLALLRLALTRLRADVCWQIEAPAAAQAELLQAAQAARVLQAAQATQVGEQPLSREEGPPLGLLFPSANAQPLLQGGPHAPKRLLVLDGTWSTVRALFRGNPVLKQLPHYVVAPDRLDRYRIRREPKAHYTSTLEATVAALMALDPHREQELRALLEAFSTMIDRQLALRQGRHVIRRRSRRPLAQA